MTIADEGLFFHTSEKNFPAYFELLFVFLERNLDKKKDVNSLNFDIRIIWAEHLLKNER